MATGVFSRAYSSLKSYLSTISKTDWVFGLLPVFIYFPLYFVVGTFLSDELMQMHMSYRGNDPEAVIAILAKYGDFYFKTGRHPLILIYNPIGLFLNLFTGNPAMSALIISSVACSITLVLFYSLLRSFELLPFRAFLFTMLLGGSFEHIIAGIIPETYIFTGCSIILLMVIHARVKNERKFLYLYLPASVLSVGMAATCIAPVTIVLVVRYWNRGIWQMTQRIAGYYLGIFLLTTIVAYIHTSIYGSNFFLSGKGHYTHMIGPYFDFTIITNPLKSLAYFLPAFFKTHMVGPHGYFGFINNFEGYYSGDHLTIAQDASFQFLWVEFFAKLAYLIIALLGLVGYITGFRKITPLFVIMILYVGFTIIFHILYNPSELHSYATLFAFSQVTLLAIGIQHFKLFNIQDHKWGNYAVNAMLLALVLLIIANNLVSLDKAVYLMNSFPWG